MLARLQCTLAACLLYVSKTGQAGMSTAIDITDISVYLLLTYS